MWPGVAIIYTVVFITSKLFNITLNKNYAFPGYHHNTRNGQTALFITNLINSLYYHSVLHYSVTSLIYSIILSRCSTDSSSHFIGFLLFSQLQELWLILWAIALQNWQTCNKVCTDLWAKERFLWSKSLSLILWEKVLAHKKVRRFFNWLIWELACHSTEIIQGFHRDAPRWSCKK